jgi:hypothetical protein
MRATLFLVPLLLGLSAACRTAEPAPALPQGADAKREDEGWRLGGELQGYPAGVVAGVVATHRIYDEDDFYFRLGYNLTERSDFGEHDDESGGGPGFGMGTLHYFSDRGEPGWILGVRFDLWWLEVDWVNDADQLTPKQTGTTDIVVFQPVLETGYVWPGASDLFVTLGVGMEINVHTDGDDVGEGAILMLGLRYVL